MQHAYATTNLSSGATVTCDRSTAAGTSVDSLDDGRMDKLWQVDATYTTATVTVDLGSAKSVNCVAILNHNAAPSGNPATLVITYASDSGFTTNTGTAYNGALGTTAPRHKDHALQFAAVSRRYWRLAFTWSSAVQLAIGELYFASTTALSRAVIYGHGEAEEYATTRFDGYTGETRGVYLAGPYRVKSFGWADLDESDRDEVLAMHRATYGGAATILWVWEYATSGTSTDAQDVIWGRFDEGRFMWTEADFELFDLPSVTLRSLGREAGA